MPAVVIPAQYADLVVPQMHAGGRGDTIPRARTSGDRCTPLAETWSDYYKQFTTHSGLPRILFRSGQRLASNQGGIE